MRKIPTLFRRDPDDMARVLPEVTPGCEWVLAGEGAPTRKYDGTAVLVRRDGLAVRVFTRREVKPGKEPPDGFIEVDHDPVTDKRVGWVPADLSTRANRWLAEALDFPSDAGPLVPGTYELCGPRINGNPEQLPQHHLIPHGMTTYPLGVVPEDPEAAWRYLGAMLSAYPFEGVVWHHRDGTRMAKLKRRDYPTEATP